MYSDEQLAEYMEEIRKQVCSCCIERPPEGPPCAPLGKQCGIESNLPQLLDAVHSTDSDSIDPYIEALHGKVCAQCNIRPTDQCPCPLEQLIVLTVQAIETVDQGRQAPEPLCDEKLQRSCRERWESTP